jgi:hypothetical protein
MMRHMIRNEPLIIHPRKQKAGNPTERIIDPLIQRYRTMHGIMCSDEESDTQICLQCHMKPQAKRSGIPFKHHEHICRM